MMLFYNSLSSGAIKFFLIFDIFACASCNEGPDRERGQKNDGDQGPRLNVCSFASLRSKEVLSGPVSFD